jgi:hypothetical protein
MAGSCLSTRNKMNINVKKISKSYINVIQLMVGYVIVIVRKIYK